MGGGAETIGLCQEKREGKEAQGTQQSPDCCPRTEFPEEWESGKVGSRGPQAETKGQREEIVEWTDDIREKKLEKWRVREQVWNQPRKE